MKQLIIFAVISLLMLASCKKGDIEQQSTGTFNGYIIAVQANLKDSLSPGDYAALDFTQATASGIDCLHIKLLRIPLRAEDALTHFFIVRTDGAGHILKGRFVSIVKDSAQKKAFTGSIAYRTMKGRTATVARFMNGHRLTAAGTVSSLKAEEDPVVDGGDLPPVIVSASYGSGGISYADWYNLLDMAGDGGGYSAGYYSPASGGGGGGGGSAPTMQVDFEAPESKDAIDIKKYINCFGATQDASSTYTVTIAVDLPVDNDPTKIFNWSDASPGHTFIELYKNGTGGLVEQHIGLYPDYPWKTVGGGDVASKVADDAGHEYQAKYIISVTGAQFANALKAAETYSSYDYNVATFNCADFALKVFTAAGGQLSVPQFGVPGYSTASNTPQGVYDAIQGKVLAGDSRAMANAQKQWIGDSHGPCN